jgi:CubicO group peptidase (beta-lactamase class C family)
MGGGGLYGTAPDYVAFIRMLLNNGSLNGNRVLKPETVTMMAQNHIGELQCRQAADGDAAVLQRPDTTIVPVGEKQFLFLVSRTPHFALNVMRVLTERLRLANALVH